MSDCPISTALSCITVWPSNSKSTESIELPSGYASTRLLTCKMVTAIPGSSGKGFANLHQVKSVDIYCQAQALPQTFVLDEGGNQAPSFTGGQVFDQKVIAVVPPNPFYE